MSETITIETLQKMRQVMSENKVPELQPFIVRCTSDFAKDFAAIAGVEWQPDDKGKQLIGQYLVITGYAKHSGVARCCVLVIFREVIKVDENDLLRRFAGCVREIIVEAQRNPHDCLECIANDAVMSWGIPLEVFKNDDDDIVYDVVVKK